MNAVCLIKVINSGCLQQKFSQKALETLWPIRAAILQCCFLVLSCIGVGVTNNNGFLDFMIGFIGTSLQLQLINTAHTQS
jgi:diacylglycerol kinase